jgi:hypothetical protein
MKARKTELTAPDCAAQSLCAAQRSRAGAAAAGRSVPRFCQREAAAFSRCGILAHGFVRVHCGGCGHDDVVAFSRAMGEASAHPAVRRGWWIRRRG